MEMSERIWRLSAENRVEKLTKAIRIEKKKRHEKSLSNEIINGSLSLSFSPRWGSSLKSASVLELFSIWRVEKRKNIGREMINIDWTEMITLLTTHSLGRKRRIGCHIPESQSECRQTWFSMLIFQYTLFFRVPSSTDNTTATLVCI